MATLHDFLSAGVTYRKLDYWTTKGLLHAEERNPGSGFTRTWPDDEVRVAIIMVQLTAAGVDLAVAHRIARDDPRVSAGVLALMGGE